MPISLDFKNKVILVCGVARGGIGGATVRNLAELGASVACVDRTQDIIDATLNDTRLPKERSIGIVADLLVPSQTAPHLHLQYRPGRSLEPKPTA
jgi:NAD(P)-dependent dehydrogenase (short-subunit alcohol dehydrogenase family)